jgi:hypothetical protein
VPWKGNLLTLRAAQARTSRRSPQSGYDPVSLPRRPCDARTWTSPSAKELPFQGTRWSRDREAQGGNDVAYRGALMGNVALRVFIYSILPLIMAVGHLCLDKSSRSRERRIEIFLLYLFGIGVAGRGIGGFFGHFFISDTVAKSIGWPTGNPFQLEVGFAGYSQLSVVSR